MAGRHDEHRPREVLESLLRAPLRDDQVEPLGGDRHDRDREVGDPRQLLQTKPLRRHRCAQHHEDHAGQQDRQRRRHQQPKPVERRTDRHHAEHHHGHRHDAPKEPRLTSRRRDQRRQKGPEGRHPNHIPEEHHHERAERQHQHRLQQREGKPQPVEQRPDIEGREGGQRPLRRHLPPHNLEPVIKVGIRRVAEERLVAPVEHQVVCRQLSKVAVRRVKGHPASARKGLHPLVRGPLLAALQHHATHQPRRDPRRPHQRHQKPALAVAARLAQPQRRQRIGGSREGSELELLHRVEHPLDPLPRAALIALHLLRQRDDLGVVRLHRLFGGQILRQPARMLLRHLDVGTKLEPLAQQPHHRRVAQLRAVAHLGAEPVAYPVVTLVRLREPEGRRRRRRQRQHLLTAVLHRQEGAHLCPLPMAVERHRHRHGVFVVRQRIRQRIVQHAHLVAGRQQRQQQQHRDEPAHAPALLLRICFVRCVGHAESPVPSGERRSLPLGRPPLAT